eukprot:2423503-Rhodomonas_salina.1
MEGCRVEWLMCTASRLILRSTAEAGWRIMAVANGASIVTVRNNFSLPPPPRGVSSLPASRARKEEECRRV